MITATSKENGNSVGAPLQREAKKLLKHMKDKEAEEELSCVGLH